MSSMPRATTVLIVEDEHIARRALSSLLLSHGFRTTAYESAEDLLLEAEDHKRPHVALIDVDLPGMSGLDLIPRLEKRWPNMLMVLVTASEGRDIDDFRESHTVEYLPKPLDFPALLSLLTRSHKPV